MDCEMTSLLQNAGDEEKEDDGQSNKIKYKVMWPDLCYTSYSEPSVAQGNHRVIPLFTHALGRNLRC